jgi:peptide deformylase
MESLTPSSGVSEDRALTYTKYMNKEILKKERKKIQTWEGCLLFCFSFKDRIS